MRIKVNLRAFVEDFDRGFSNRELAAKHDLTLVQLETLVQFMLEKGYLTPEQVSRNSEYVTSHSSGAATATRQEARVQTDRPPFEVVRGRTLFLYGLGALAAAFFYGIIMSFVLLGDHGFDARAFVMFGVVFYVFIALLVRNLLARAKLAPTAVLGPHPTWSVFRRHVILVVPLLIVAIVALYLLYFPLSFVAPRLVSRLILDSSFDFCSRDSVLTNVLGFLVIVVFAPVVEEFVFRGLLFTRWSLKWSIQRGILFSSLAFGLGHVDVIGAFFFGYVMCIAYIETKSLLVPIGIHMANNGIAWILEAISMLVSESDANMTLAEWQSYWWAALLAGVVVVPWVVLFVRRHFPSQDWRVPYLSIKEGVERTGELATTA